MASREVWAWRPDVPAGVLFAAEADWDALRALVRERVPDKLPAVAKRLEWRWRWMILGVALVLTLIAYMVMEHAGH
jgi:hypothetical protein